MPQVAAENVYSQITYAAPYVELIEEYTLVEHLELLKKNQYLPFSINIDIFEKFIELSPDRHKPIKNYSSGMRQKIKLGFALLSDRPVLLLDEPTTNFDESAKNWFFDRLNEQKEKLIIIASNEAREIEFCSHRISIQDFK
jgi:ABC-type multidrug transport system ATPase subunit